MTLYPLANPKGVERLCELCRKPAYIQCTKCRVTYYCDIEHQAVDRLGIHDKICESLNAICQPVTFMPSKEERMRREKELLGRKHKLIHVAQTTAKKLLYEGKHEKAIPAALQSVRFSIDVYGNSSIELVPSYLILAEASIGLGHLSEADEYLANAQWIVMKMPDCPNSIKYKFYRILGILFAAKGEYCEALSELAEDIYHASEEYGTDALQTSGGYFHMANVFFREGKMDSAESLYRQVADIWYSYLSKIVESRANIPIARKKVALSIEKAASGLDEAQEAEGVLVLNALYDMWEAYPDKKTDDLSKVSLALSLLYYLLGKKEKSEKFGRKAFSSSQEFSDDVFQQVIMKFIKFMENNE